MLLSLFSRASLEALVYHISAIRHHLLLTISSQQVGRLYCLNGYNLSTVAIIKMFQTCVTALLNIVANLGGLYATWFI